MGRYLLGIVIGLVLVPIGVFCYFKYGNPPVAVNDKPLPYEKLVTGVPLHARIDREMVKTPPVQADEDTFMAGAQLYADNCAVCHGYHGQPSRIGSHEYPKAPPLWEAHHNGNVVGVSDDPPGETYWKVANGIRLTGMPCVQGPADGDPDVAGEPAAGQRRQAAAAGGAGHSEGREGGREPGNGDAGSAGQEVARSEGWGWARR